MKKTRGAIATIMISLMLVTTVYAAPADEPVSTTGTVYGYDGAFAQDSAYTVPANVSEGEWELTDAQMIYWDGTALQNSGIGSLVVRNSYIRGESTTDTIPVTELANGLLSAGSLHTVLVLGTSRSYFINSSIISRNLAAVTMSGNESGPEESSPKLSLYAYGSETITMDGGCGIYTGQYSNLYSYGSHIQAAEIGIICDTFGKVTIGTIQNGEDDPDLAVVLQEEKAGQTDKELRSVVEGGRNALMVIRADQTASQEYQADHQGEPLYVHATVTAYQAVLRTDRNLDKGVAYEPALQAYINHTAGSVILVRSANVLMELNACELIPDENGTSYLIQTVCSNDTGLIDTVPDGSYVEGVSITMQDMKVEGDIVHEDYQRVFDLNLKGTALEGAINEYDCGHWNAVAAAEGFSDYVKEESYQTHHGIHVSLEAGSVWNVTEESQISSLWIEDGSQVTGILYVDGVQQEIVSGLCYEGNLTVQPSGQEETAQQETTQQTVALEEHIHNWVSNGGYAPTCEEDGIQWYLCTVCGAEYSESLPALGHNWVYEGVRPADCIHAGVTLYQCSREGCNVAYGELTGEEALGHNWVLESTVSPTCTEAGENAYICTRCGYPRTEETPATGHYWHPDLIVAATCTTEGKEVYSCGYCGLVESGTYPALGHEYVLTSSVSPTETDWGQNVYTCTRCGDSYTESVPPLGSG